MNLLNAEQLHKHLLEDLENCESYSFAIAWVTNNDYYQSIYENIEKVETGVIGLNLYMLCNTNIRNRIKLLKNLDNTANHYRLACLYKPVFNITLLIIRRTSSPFLLL